MQRIGKRQRELQDPSIDKGERSYLERLVKSYYSAIDRYNVSISSIGGELAELVGERAAILNQGEPTGCHADECRDRLPRQHVTMVT